MKIWLGILTICLIFQSSAGAKERFIADFSPYGMANITDTPWGLKTEFRLSAEPSEKYMFKFLSQCQSGETRWSHFRHKFEVLLTTDRMGHAAYTMNFHKLHKKDLESRRLNTMALFKLEKSYWRRLQCVVLLPAELEHLELPTIMLKN